MTPLVSSILGFPEEKGNACVMLEIEEDEEESKSSPEMGSAGGRKTSSAVAPASAVLVLVDMDRCQTLCN